MTEQHDAPAPPAIEVRDLTFRYPGAERDSLVGADLTIRSGDFVAVVGGNGSGKTTLCKSFNGLVPHFWNGDMSGDVLVHGRSTSELTVAELAAEVGYVFQDFGAQLVRPTVREDVSFAPQNLGHTDWAERTDAALAALELDSIADEFTWQLSGGQQHLTAIAGALALAPRVLVVDEPAAEVDPARAVEIYEQLVRLNRLGITIVVIEHHADLVARYARSVVLMSGGRVRWHLPTAAAMSRTADLAEADIPPPQVVQVAAALLPSLLEGGEPPLTVQECAHRLRSELQLSAQPHAVGAQATAAAAGPAVARVAGVAHEYRSVRGGTRTVLDGIDLELVEGDRLALVGSNGAGKSTLLSLLAGLNIPRNGDIEVNGRNTRHFSAGQLADDVCLLIQRPQDMFLTDSIRTDVAMHPRGRRLRLAHEVVEDALAQVRLTDVADRDARLVSGGQQRRAALAVGLAMRPSLLLLDEPTSSLDSRTRDDVVAMLAALTGSIRCTVVATHDMQLVAEWATRVVVLDQGRVLADTTPTVLFDSPDLLAQARLVAPQVSQLAAQLDVRPPPLTVDGLLAAIAPDHVRHRERRKMLETAQ